MDEKELSSAIEIIDYFSGYVAECKEKALTDEQREQIREAANVCLSFNALDWFIEGQEIYNNH